MPGHGVRGCGSLYIEQREERLFIKLKYFMAITYTLCKENCKTGIDRMSIDILLGKVTLVGNQLTLPGEVNDSSCNIIGKLTVDTVR